MFLLFHGAYFQVPAISFGGGGGAHEFVISSCRDKLRKLKSRENTSCFHPLWRYVFRSQELVGNVEQCSSNQCQHQKDAGPLAIQPCQSKKTSQHGWRVLLPFRTAVCSFQCGVSTFTFDNWSCFFSSFPKIPGQNQLCETLCFYIHWSSKYLKLVYFLVRPLRILPPFFLDATYRIHILDLPNTQWS